MRRCIYCGTAEDLSDSDIIPDALTASRIINKCVCHVEHNSGMTEKFESEVVEKLAFLLNHLDKESKKIEKLEEDAKREEKEFLEIDPEKRSLRAEKLFRMNQKELMRYYDMNLAQTKFLSGLGIMMILFGIIIVAGSLYMYMSLNGDKVLLSVGSLSGIVVDFIGAVFIKMYTKNIEASRTGNNERAILEYLIGLLKMNKDLIMSDVHIVVRNSGKETIPITEL